MDRYLHHRARKDKHLHHSDLELAMFGKIGKDSQGEPVPSWKDSPYWGWVSQVTTARPMWKSLSMDTAKLSGSVHGVIHKFHVSPAGVTRLRLNVTRSASNAEAHAFVFNEASPCVSLWADTISNVKQEWSQVCDALFRRANCQGLANCLGAVSAWSGLEQASNPAYMLTLNKTAEFTVQQWAHFPSRAWYVLVMVAGSGVESYDIEFNAMVARERHAQHMLLWSGIFMFIVPFAVLGLTDLILELVHLFRRNRGCAERPLPIRNDMTCGQLFGAKLAWFRPNFPSLLALAAICFLSGSVQLSLSVQLGMEKSGNRDKCFYNERCYYPDPMRGTHSGDYAFNNILSHIGYFVCAAYCTYFVFRAELMCKRALPKDSSLHVEFNIYYAICLAVFLEGFGSILYHMCPSMLLFQFDTAFMLPIAHLSTVALVSMEHPWQVDPPRSGKRPLTYVLFIVCPLWLFDFYGTWNDQHIFRGEGEAKGPSHHSFMFRFLVLAWVLFVILVLLPRLTADADRTVSNNSYWKVLVLVLVSCAAGVLLPTQIVDRAQGTANLFLLLSIAIMVATLVLRLYIDLQNQVFGLPRASYTVFAISLPFWYEAIALFSEKVNDPLDSASNSRDLNSICVFGAFDKHDMWHLFSALGLALWIMTLVELRLSSLSSSPASTSRPECERVALEPLLTSFGIIGSRDTRPST